MIRRLAQTVAVLLSAAVPALAQTHPQGHDQKHPHDRAGHVPYDSAHHAAMHAHLLGTWQGSFSSPRLGSSGLDLSVAHDSGGKLTLRMRGDQALHAAAAADLVMNGDQLQWTLEWSGAPCKASARLSAATASGPEVLEGKMACAAGEVGFTLRKKTE